MSARDGGNRDGSAGIVANCNDGSNHQLHAPMLSLQKLGTNVGRDANHGSGIEARSRNGEAELESPSRGKHLRRDGPCLLAHLAKPLIGPLQVGTAFRLGKQERREHLAELSLEVLDPVVAVGVVTLMVNARVDDGRNSINTHLKSTTLTRCIS